MMKISIMKLKIISFFIILLLYSCSTNKVAISKHNIGFAVQDYLKTFLSYNTSKPYAIYISVDDKSLISIKDLSKNVSLGYMEEIQHKDVLKVGKLYNTTCFYLDNEIKEGDYIFKKSNIKSKKIRTETIILNGKELIIPYDNKMEWEPTLEIEYNFILKKKVINDYVGTELKVLFW